MLDITTQYGWKYGGAWKKKLCPDYRPATTKEPPTTRVPAWKTREPTVVPSVCEPSLTQVEISIVVTPRYINSTKAIRN